MAKMVIQRTSGSRNQLRLCERGATGLLGGVAVEALREKLPQITIGV
jgi:hypothetical protein